MPLKIVRNDITKMQCDAIVNTANKEPISATGCDYAIYKAAGYDKLLKYRKEKIGFVNEGDCFITPAFDLKAKFIIHAVSPLFIDGKSKEEEKLRSCYKNSLRLAFENNVKSIAFPLISTGRFCYPKEEGMRIAVDEFNGFLMTHQMLIYLVVFDNKATSLGESIYPNLKSYIDHNYVNERKKEEYKDILEEISTANEIKSSSDKENFTSREAIFVKDNSDVKDNIAIRDNLTYEEDFYDKHEIEIRERMNHMSDTFSEYLLYLIKNKGLTNSAVYKKAIVDKKVFSKIKNNPDYHPQKITAMCLCIGAELSLDESTNLLARAGYALSPCDKTDVIFSYFIENKMYDMIELDILLEEQGLKCLIS